MSAQPNTQEAYLRGFRDGRADAIAWKERWTLHAISSIRVVLECHALGAEVIALKDAKYERLQALHALEALHKVEQVLREANLIDVGEPAQETDPE